ncbi:hypothetical protein WJX73_002496 [Symbiochloris irregularis]|uniref:Centromere protein J C-terminal domain-containing protein n=1 Tax=Symbiochloris irregularis TaxID=706552 RepID=A0AAW1NRR8_9CHLO
MREQLRLASQQLQHDRAAFEHTQAEERTQWEQKHKAEVRRLAREREMLDKQTSALARLPTANERRQVDALEAILAAERKAIQAKEAKHKLTLDRMKRQLTSLQAQVNELKEEAAVADQQSAAAGCSIHTHSLKNINQHPQRLAQDLLADGSEAPVQDATKGKLPSASSAVQNRSTSTLQRGKIMRYSNGASKEEIDGCSITRFANGDVRRVMADGKEEYWYADAATWHTTWQPLGTQVFHFASGQIEAHHQGGLKEVIFADGTATFVLPSGAEVPATKQQLSAEVQFPKPILS